MKYGRRVVMLLRNRNFLLVASSILGLILGDAARATQPLILPALAVAMTVSVTQVDSGMLRSWRNLVRATLISLFLNYALLGGIKLLLARWLISDQELWTGFVLEAAVPPGAAIIPFSYILGGDPTFALLGTFGTYLSALLLMPLMAVTFAGTSLIQPLRLLTILLQLIVLPLLVSRLVSAGPLKAHIDRWRGAIVNWAFSLLFFTVIGLNRDALLNEPSVLLRSGVIALAGNFGLSFVLDWLLQRGTINRATRVTYILMGTIKNTSLGAATALALFSERTSIPAAVVSASNVLYMVWLGIRWARE
jgi:BASS family bile acid:Na+ symporter